MYARTATKLPLATWARLMGLHPLHFAQVVYVGDDDPTPSNCDIALYQHEWQDSDRVGREEIAIAIAQAEADIERELGYRLLPSWEVDEWRPTTRVNRPELFNVNAHDLRGFASQIKPKWGWFISGGQRERDSLEAGAAIDYSSEDGDLYEEQAKVEVTVDAGTSACQVRTFYPGHAGEEEWEIKPTTVTIVATTATIIFRREQAVLEALQEAFHPDPVDGSSPAGDGNFLTTVDVDRIYSDPQSQATLLWNNLPGVCGCGVSTCPICQFSTQVACLNIVGDPQLSRVSIEPATWDADALTFTTVALAITRLPDIVRTWYYAGLQDKRVACPTRDMDMVWARAVANYAAALLPRSPCTCADAQWERMTQNLSFEEGAESLSRYRLGKSDLENPFGPTRGAIEAWRRVKTGANVQGANARVALAP